MLKIDELRAGPVAEDQPVCVYDDGSHAVWWVGASEKTFMRRNAWLVVDGDVSLLIDPGAQVAHFEQVKARVSKVIDPARLSYLVVQVEDPDRCDSMPDWIALNPELQVVATPRARVLIPYYGFTPTLSWLDVSPQDSTYIELPSGKTISFISAPFLHFPEAMASYDEASGILFSSDVGSTKQVEDWSLLVEDWPSYWRKMLHFHVENMAHTKALAGFIAKVRPFPIQAILPFNGSIIPPELVGTALDALAELPVGVDLLYPESQIERVFKTFISG
ncbi:MAG: MBL fold metallo-hydrolase [Deltaproteobacteria bacterium]|nr:MBL fold metallo-hydrolase [Deltaproteobacteria bacterium]